MKRLFWLGVGITVGAVAARQISRTVRAYSPGGLAGSARESAVGLLDSVRDFVADVREGMAEREAEIHDAVAQGVTLDEVLAEDELAEHGWAGDDPVTGRASGPVGSGPERRREDGAEVPR